MSTTEGWPEGTDGHEAVPPPDLGTDDVPKVEAASPATIPVQAEPVGEAARVGPVDTLRGFAVLGILAMNIVGFGWPRDVYSTPTSAPGHTWADLFLWMINHIVFDTKMMTLFSMLFGAGLVLMSGRADARGISPRRIYYRRTFFLLLIGLVHAYLIWDGDILVWYATCGFLLYPLRRLSGRTLVVIGTLLLLMAFPVWGGGRALIRFFQRTTAEVAAVEASGTTIEPWKDNVRDAWQKIEGESRPNPEEFREKIQIYRGGYFGIVADRAGGLIGEQTFGFVLAVWWLIGGRMVLGMGLMKLGVFSGERSRAFYQRLAAVGYGVGLPLVLADIAIDWHYNFFIDRGIAYFTEGWWLINSVSSPFLTLGHVAVLMLIDRAGLFEGFTRRLAAVGRMALSNYLFDSIVCTTLFYGYGFGLFARLLRPGLTLVVAAIWAFQLVFSPIWLARFRYGPAEWAWRSLTYGRPQPFRRVPEPESVALAVALPEEVSVD